MKLYLAQNEAIVQKTACPDSSEELFKSLSRLGWGCSVCVILVKEVHEMGHVLAEGCY